MSRRKFEIGNPKNAVDGVPLSDKAVLFWERYHKPMNAAAQSLNAALVNTQNILAGIVIEMEGYDSATHLFDVDKMRIIPRPPEKDNGAVG